MPLIPLLPLLALLALDVRSADVIMAIRHRSDVIMVMLTSEICADSSQRMSMTSKKTKAEMKRAKANGVTSFFTPS